MTRKRTDSANYQIPLRITISGQVLNTLVALYRTGLYGPGIKQVAEELLRQKIREVLVAGHQGLGANAYDWTAPQQVLSRVSFHAPVKRRQKK